MTSDGALDPDNKQGLHLRQVDRLKAGGPEIPCPRRLVVRSSGPEGEGHGQPRAAPQLNRRPAAATVPRKAGLASVAGACAAPEAGSGSSMSRISTAAGH